MIRLGLKENQGNINVVKEHENVDYNSKMLPYDLRLLFLLVHLCVC